LLATTILPSAVTLIPLFVLFSKLGWVNSWLPLIVPACFGNPFYIFMLRQFFLTLPRELFDAAEIDGCHPLRAFWQVALPLATPALAAVAIFSFINSWNDFLTPLIYLNSTSKFTLSLGLSMFYGLFYTQLQYLMPMALLALLPVLTLYLLAQRYFIEGIRGFTYVS
jgi:multiple sugar transport system permease protein